MNALQTRLSGGMGARCGLPAGQIRPETGQGVVHPRGPGLQAELDAPPVRAVPTAHTVVLTGIWVTIP